MSYPDPESLRTLAVEGRTALDVELPRAEGELRATPGGPGSIDVSARGLGDELWDMAAAAGLAEASAVLAPHIPSLSAVLGHLGSGPALLPALGAATAWGAAAYVAVDSLHRYVEGSILDEEGQRARLWRSRDVYVIAARLDHYGLPAGPVRGRLYHAIDRAIAPEVNPWCAEAAAVEMSLRDSLDDCDWYSRALHALTGSGRSCRQAIDANMAEMVRAHDDYIRLVVDRTLLAVVEGIGAQAAAGRVAHDIVQNRWMQENRMPTLRHPIAGEQTARSFILHSGEWEPVTANNVGLVVLDQGFYLPVYGVQGWTTGALAIWQAPDGAHFAYATGLPVNTALKVGKASVAFDGPGGQLHLSNHADFSGPRGGVSFNLYVRRHRATGALGVTGRSTRTVAGVAHDDSQAGFQGMMAGIDQPTAQSRDFEQALDLVRGALRVEGAGGVADSAQPTSPVYDSAAWDDLTPIIPGPDYDPDPRPDHLDDGDGSLVPLALAAAAAVFLGDVL